ncbi:hypothetical protein M758_4G262800 [Ceratodon purpureus]|nr:hypothetical protein M758_4G262800 [Ceratodon purpureus]
MDEPHKLGLRVQGLRQSGTHAPVSQKRGRERGREGANSTCHQLLGSHRAKLIHSDSLSLSLSLISRIQAMAMEFQAMDVDDHYSHLHSHATLHSHALCNYQLYPPLPLSLSLSLQCHALLCTIHPLSWGPTSLTDSLTERERVCVVLANGMAVFDRLVEMIPANVYVAKENPTDLWVHGMSKKARAESKRKTKLHLKKAKRARLDPENARTTLEVIKQQEKTKDAPSESLGREADKPRTVTYEELRDRLHKRIEMLRAKRHADEAASTVKVAKDWQNQKKNDSLKLNRKSKAADPEATYGEMGAPTAKRPKLGAKAALAPSAVVEDELEFSRVKMGIGASPGQNKKKKPSKEKLLAQATALQKDMHDPEKGHEVATKHAWSAAVSRAAGEKVLDDPKLLKKSIKREEGIRNKSAKKWQERSEMEKKDQQVKQQKRKENIQQRSTEKKERAIAKREKKLARPGFEGRKQGFINNGA